MPSPSAPLLRPHSILASSASRGYPAAHTLDGSASTCWNSAASSSGQWLELTYERPVDAARLAILFQGGFVGKDMCVWVRRAAASGAGGAAEGDGRDAAACAERASRAEESSGTGAGTAGGSGAVAGDGVPSPHRGWEIAGTFEPDDSNSLQSFDLWPGVGVGVCGLRISFGRSTDFYGRVTVYTLEVMGAEGADVVG